MSSTARLSTTSEGLWLTAALCGVLELPPVLKVRPVGSVEATLADHPGIVVLERAGLCRAGVVGPDVREWVETLGRPDVEVDVVVSRPDRAPTRLLGPPPLFEAPPDWIEAARALAEWHGRRPPQRVVALCRRDGTWVSAARLWRAGDDDIDDVVVSPLGGADVGVAVREVLGQAQPAQFGGINSETARLGPVLSAWQTNPSISVVDELVRVGLSGPQARVVEAVCDAGAARATISAAEFSIDGPVWAPLALTVADTMLGRVVVSYTVGPDGRLWTTLLPGSGTAIDGAVTELLEGLPCGRGWGTHQRVRNFAAP